MITTEQKQERIENKIDSFEGFCGDDMVALIALHARKSVKSCKADKFIIVCQKTPEFIRGDEWQISLNF